MHAKAREFASVSLSRLTRLRLILLGHEDLAGMVFWAALIGLIGALASVAFRESIRLFTRVFTGYVPMAGQSEGLVDAASRLVWAPSGLICAPARPRFAEGGITGGMNRRLKSGSYTRRPKGRLVCARGWWGGGARNQKDTSGRRMTEESIFRPAGIKPVSPGCSHARSG